MRTRNLYYLLTAVMLFTLIATSAQAAANWHQSTRVGPRFRSGNQILAAPTTGDFTDIGAHFPIVGSSDVVWGDYNKDGKLDLAMTGNTGIPTPDLATVVYHNDGQGQFTLDSSANFSGTNIAALAWGDYNNDGNLDLAHTGNNIHDVSTVRLYTGDGQGGFSEDVATNFPPFFMGSVAWGDFNHDGKPDLLLGGPFSGVPQGITLYLGNGQGSFTQATHIDLNAGQLVVGDYNNDGNLDFAVLWRSQTDAYTSVYMGDGHDNFTLDQNAVLPGADIVSWVDYNNDGNLDLVLNNYGPPASTRLFAGDGHGHFTEDTQSGLPGVNNRFAWGDFNNDGNLDVAIPGDPFTTVYTGDGLGHFTLDAQAQFAIRDGLARWGDYNNDGKLDLLLVGDNNSSQQVGAIYRNDSNSPANQPPTAPSGLSAATLATDTVSLTWQPASDDHTPAATLSYNLRVGTSPGGSDVVGPMANVATGQRRLPELGNAQLNRHAILTGLNPSTIYYWSVQAIDNSYQGGPFAQEGSFTLNSLATATPTSTATTATSTPTNVSNTPTATPTLPLSTPTASSTVMPSATSTAANTPVVGTATSTSTPGGPTSTPALATMTPTDCANVFGDITGNIFYSAIHYLNCRGVINGTDATHYTPAGISTRGQFAKVVVLGFGTPFHTPATPDFNDVPTSYFAYLYIESGFHAAILSGFDTASCQAAGQPYPCYLPNRPITRAQLTKLVVNAAHYPLFTPSGGSHSFSDVLPSNVFFVAVETALSKGVINGYPDGSFRPNNNIRRDEMAQIVYKGVTTP